MAALFIRNILMKDTQSPTNTVEADRQPEAPKLSEFLPDVMKNED